MKNIEKKMWKIENNHFSTKALLKILVYQKSKTKQQ